MDELRKLIGAGIARTNPDETDTEYHMVRYVAYVESGPFLTCDYSRRDIVNMIVDGDFPRVQTLEDVQEWWDDIGSLDDRDSLIEDIASYFGG